MVGGAVNREKQGRATVAAMIVIDSKICPLFAMIIKLLKE